MRVHAFSLLCLCVAPPAAGAVAPDKGDWHVLIRHEGATDPSAEGWQRQRLYDGKVAEGPIARDAVGGLAAWSIDDGGTGKARATLSYQKVLNDQTLTSMAKGRWRFVAHLRVVASKGKPNFSVGVEVGDATRRYMARFSLDGKGGTQATLGLRSPLRSATVPGVGYHRYEFVFDPSQGEHGELSLFVDGGAKPLIAGYPGEPSGGVGGPRLVWGANQGASSGHGHYHFVEFSTEKPVAPAPPVPPSRVAVDNVCAWPNLTVLPDGAIVAMIYSLPSHGGGEGDAQCWASEDGGLTWRLRGTPARHEPKTCRMNLAAGLARDNDLLVLCSGWDKHPTGKPRYERILKPFVSRSSDGGRTWRVSKAFPREPGMGEFIPFGDIIQARDGSLCVSAYAQKADSKKTGYNSYFLRSTDDGRTWSRVAMIAPDHNETAVLQRPDGTWLAAARRSGLALFASKDNGKTWRLGGRTTSGQHPGHLRRLADGRLLLSHGDRRPGALGVGVRISADAGQTWSRASTPIARTRHADCGYPSTIQLPDGRLMTAYYAKKSALHPRYHMAVVFWSVADVFGSRP